MSDSKNWRSIRSYGIILVKNYQTTPEYLLVCRKSTYCYVDYLLGKYNEKKIEYLNFMIENMTVQERENILTRPYPELWNELYSSTRPASGSFFNYVMSKFLRMSATFHIHHKSLPKLYKYPEWGFPKGRLNHREDPLDCAMRELFEETRISPSMYEIETSILPYEEKYVGTNGIGYRNFFFVAFSKPGCEGFIDQSNNAQTREIGSIEWMNFEQAMCCFRCLEPSKKQLLREIDTAVRRYKTRYIQAFQCIRDTPYTRASICHHSQ